MNRYEISKFKRFMGAVEAYFEAKRDYEKRPTDYNADSVFSCLGVAQDAFADAVREATGDKQ